MRVLIFLAAVFLVSCSKQDIEISQGGGLSSHALKEKTVVLNIWADWCPPCIVEMPYFNKLTILFLQLPFYHFLIVVGFAYFLIL